MSEWMESISRPMVKQVAEALVNKLDEMTTGDYTLNYGRPYGLLACEELAMAAIEAMRTPTEAMVSAAMADDGIDMPLARGYDEVWASMIDAALAPTLMQKETGE